MYFVVFASLNEHFVEEICNKKSKTFKHILEITWQIEDAER